MAGCSLKIDELRDETPLLYHQNALAKALFSSAKLANYHPPVAVVLPDGEVAVGVNAPPAVTHVDVSGPREGEEALQSRLRGDSIVAFATATDGALIEDELQSLTWWMAALIAAQAVFVMMALSGTAIWPFPHVGGGGGFGSSPMSLFRHPLSHQRQSLLVAIIASQSLPFGGILFRIPSLFMLHTCAISFIFFFYFLIALTGWVDVAILATLPPMYIASSRLNYHLSSHLIKFKANGYSNELD